MSRQPANQGPASERPEREVTTAPETLHQASVREAPVRSTSHPALPLISAIVLTLNEAAHIEPCLRTLQWADELLVVDSRSTDGTSQLASALGARVISHPWVSFAAQRNFALSQVSHPWVCFVDADERVPLELAQEIRQQVQRANAIGTPSGFWLPRQNLIMGTWVQAAGWSPDYQLRVFRRDRGSYDPGRPVHELVQLAGESAHLTHRLVHHNYVSWRQFWSKQRRYARDEAGALFARSIRVKPQNFVLQPLREFQRRFWTLEGYRAGTLGLALSAVLAAANFVMYVDLWRRQRTGSTAAANAADGSRSTAGDRR